MEALKDAHHDAPERVLAVQTGRISKGAGVTIGAVFMGLYAVLFLFIFAKAGML